MRKKKYIKFKCIQCGHTFLAHSASYNGTILTCPVKCPQCNSLKTRPKSFFGCLNNKLYAGIWEEFELKSLLHKE